MLSAQSGSNSWVISGNYTKSGYPILVGDPHLLKTVPDTFYQWAIKTKNMHIKGFSFTGAPMFAFARNDFMAWTWTMHFA